MTMTKWTIAGFLLGFFVAFLCRPSGFLVGQLPFEVVITGGQGLTGLESLYAPLAQQSRNLCMAGGLAGSIVAFMVTGLAQHNKGAK